MKRRDSGRTTDVRRSIGTAGVVASLLALCVGAAGCSTTTTGDRPPVSTDRLSADPLTAVRSAADITGRTGSVRSASRVVTRSTGKKAVFTGTGVYDFVKRIGTVSVVLPPGATTKGKMTEVVLPGTVYLQNSGARVPVGKWVKLEVQQLPDGNLVSSGTTDPASAAGALRGARDAKLIGKENTGGTVLMHYRGTLDLAKAAEATGGHGAQGLLMAARTFTVKNVPYDVWLDGFGRLHKVVEVFTFASVPGSTAKKDQVVVTSTTSLSDFGSPVVASTPASSDVFAMKVSGTPR